MDLSKTYLEIKVVDAFLIFCCADIPGVPQVYLYILDRKYMQYSNCNVTKLYIYIYGYIYYIWRFIIWYTFIPMDYAHLKQFHHWDSWRKTQGQPKETVFLAGDFHDVHVDRGWADLLPQALGFSGFLGKWFCNLPSVNLVDSYASIHLSSN